MKMMIRDAPIYYGRRANMMSDDDDVDYADAERAPPVMRRWPMSDEDGEPE